MLLGRNIFEVFLFRKFITDDLVLLYFATLYPLLNLLFPFTDVGRHEFIQILLFDQYGDSLNILYCLLRSFLSNHLLSLLQKYFGFLTCKNLLISSFILHFTANIENCLDLSQRFFNFPHTVNPFL